MEIQVVNMGENVKIGIAEALMMAAKEPDVDNKLAILSMHDSPQLRMMIKYILCPTVVWWKALKGESYTKSPSYKPNRYLDAEGRLYSDMRLIYMFVDSGDEEWGLPPGKPLRNDQIITRMGLQQNPPKRERLWCQLLESITPDDAELLGNAANKAFPFEGLSREVIDMAFPGLLAPEKLDDVSVIAAPIADAPTHGIPPQKPATEVVELSAEDILGEHYHG